MSQIGSEWFLRKNPASNLEQNRSRHSYCYVISRFCPRFFAVFSGNSIPSCNIRANPPTQCRQVICTESGDLADDHRYPGLWLCIIREWSVSRLFLRIAFYGIHCYLNGFFQLNITAHTPKFGVKINLDIRSHTLIFNI